MDKFGYHPPALCLEACNIWRRLQVFLSGTAVWDQRSRRQAHPEANDYTVAEAAFSRYVSLRML